MTMKEPLSLTRSETVRKRRVIPTGEPSRKARIQVSECRACRTNTNAAADFIFPVSLSLPSFDAAFGFLADVEAIAAQHPERNGLRCGTRPARKETWPQNDLIERVVTTVLSSIALAEVARDDTLDCGMRTRTSVRHTSISAPIQTSAIPAEALCQASGKPKIARQSNALVKLVVRVDRSPLATKMGSST